MGERTAIEWTDATWNPWRGCAKVSPGCARCYMFREQRRYGRSPDVVERSRTTFDAPLRWPTPTLVFTCSWSDWFHDAADEWRDAAWEIIRRTPQHTYQILTKRIERAHEHLPADWGDGYPNVWLGVSIENARYTWRADALRELPARLRFISAEPLLGSLFRDDARRAPLDLAQIAWLIAGGESGPRARPVDASWLRELRDACQDAGTAFFFKQWGGRTPKAGGRLLDGRAWSELPKPTLRRAGRAAAAPTRRPS